MVRESKYRAGSSSDIYFLCDEVLSFMAHTDLALKYIPNHVLIELKPETIDKLRYFRFGINFVSKTRVRLRYMQNGHELGRYYALNNFKNWEQLINVAISHYRYLSLKHPNRTINHQRKKLERQRKNLDLNPNNGVQFIAKKNSRNVYYYYFKVHYSCNGDAKYALFSVGTAVTMDMTRMTHAHDTAWYFRRLFCKTHDPCIFSKENKEKLAPLRV